MKDENWGCFLAFVTSLSVLVALSRVSLGFVAAVGLLAFGNGICCFNELITTILLSFML